MNTTTEQLFTDARSHNGYHDIPVPDEKLRALYELLKWGPTSGNSTPARFLFVRSPKAKATLIDCVSAGNKEKVRQAPVTAIIGMDLRFYDELPRLFPHTDEKSWFVGNPPKIQDTALRN